MTQGVGLISCPDACPPPGVGVADPDDGTDDGEVLGVGAAPDDVAAGDEFGTVPLGWVVGVLVCEVAGCCLCPPFPPTRLPTLVPVECLPHTAASSGLPTDSSMIVTITMATRNRPSATPR